MKTRIFCYCFALLLAVLAVAPANGGEQEKGRNRLNKPMGSLAKTYLNINNISTVFWNNGFADIDTNGQHSGFVFPKGSHKTAILESGLLWGARYGTGGAIRVGGSTYQSGLQPGKVVTLGVAEDPNLPKNRIYRVRPDYQTSDLSSEMADEGITKDQARAQYERDWNEWPAADGAPFDDKNGNGIYEPDVDTPGVKDAGQTIWFVCNDLDSNKTKALYGSLPMGIEMQVTVWGYSQPVQFENMFFKSYLLINRSNTTFDTMYVAQWLDPDIGNYRDDFAGCDTSLSLGYAYNAAAVDSLYAPLPPPAAGMSLLQGPTVPSAGSTAISKGRTVSNHRNLSMTAFYYHGVGDPTLTNPPFGSYQGTVEWYNIFRGLVGKTGQRYVDPTTGRPTTFLVDGDPIARTGYIDGVNLPRGERRMALSSGPFTMAPGDTQEVVVAEIAAGAFPPVDRLGAVGLLKYYTAIVRTLTVDVKKEQNLPASFELYQNFPNPFNPATDIRYQLSAVGHVNLKIYDILGQEVKTLVDEIQSAGERNVQWNGTNNAGRAVASGVYFYRMEARWLAAQRISTIQTKKMLLLR